MSKSEGKSESKKSGRVRILSKPFPDRLKDDYTFVGELSCVSSSLSGKEYDSVDEIPPGEYSHLEGTAYLFARQNLANREPALYGLPKGFKRPDYMSDFRIFDIRRSFVKRQGKYTPSVGIRVIFNGWTRKSRGLLLDLISPRKSPTFTDEEADEGNPFVGFSLLGAPDLNEFENLSDIGTEKDLLAAYKKWSFAAYSVCDSRGELPQARFYESQQRAPEDYTSFRRQDSGEEGLDEDLRED